MVDFRALITNPTGWYKFFHTVTSGYVIAAFFVMGISAYHLLRKNEVAFFRRSFRMAAVFGLVSTLLVAVDGDLSAANMAKVQPAKFAASESLWETQKGAGFNFIVIPNADRECNEVESVCVPNGLSLLAFHTPDAEIKGLKAFPKEERPPVSPTFVSFRVMFTLGFIFILLSLLAVVYGRKNTLESRRFFLTIMLYAIPLPYLAAQLGWIVAEVGRQPWIVYGVLKTSDAVSRSISPVQVWASLLGFTLLYGSLGVVDVYLLTKYAKKGPQ